MAGVVVDREMGGNEGGGNQASSPCDSVGSLPAGSGATRGRGHKGVGEER